MLTATILHLREPADAGFLRWYVGEVEPVLENVGSRRLALLETEPAANTFPRLPVREGDHTLVRLASFGNEATLATFLRHVEASSAWAAVMGRLMTHLVTDPHILRLQPTPRSLLR